jgi:hypothetical protein
MCEIVAKARGWTVEQAARVTLENARRVFAFSRVPPGPPMIDDDEVSDGLRDVTLNETTSAAAGPDLSVRADDGSGTVTPDVKEDADEGEAEYAADEEEEENDCGWWVRSPLD